MLIIKRIRLDLSKFDTNKVTNMNFMFYECSSLEELNLSNWNINNVRVMIYMFDKCSDELKKKVRAQFLNIKEEAFNIYE